MRCEMSVSIISSPLREDGRSLSGGGTRVGPHERCRHQNRHNDPFFGNSLDAGIYDIFFRKFNFLSEDSHSKFYYQQFQYQFYYRCIIYLMYSNNDIE